jgi:succinate dehydrogenase/fumarate reductase flavoprotein subunit
MSRGWTRRHALAIESPSGPRFELALERFREGHSFEFHDVGFRRGPDGVVHAQIESSWGGDYVTQDTALLDLAEAERVLEELAEASPAFRETVATQPIEYEVCEDYGMASVRVCSRRNGVFNWGTGFPRSAG